MLQGWIEWAKVCKLTILHDLATFYLGVLIITMSPVDIVMTRGSLFLFITFLQMLSKPCLSLSFAFVSKAKCLLLLLLPPPCHDQDHLHIAWGWDEPPSPLLCPSFSFLLASTSVIHMMIWVFFPPHPLPDKSFFHMVSFRHLSCLFMILFQLEMVCIVWEVCVFAHLPSYWMLFGDCSRLLPVILCSQWVH